MSETVTGAHVNTNPDPKAQARTPAPYIVPVAPQQIVRLLRSSHLRLASQHDPLATKCTSLAPVAPDAPNH